MLTDVLAYLHIKLASVLLCNYRVLVYGSDWSIELIYLSCSDGVRLQMIQSISSTLRC